MEERDRTDDRVTVESAEAIKKYNVGIKVRPWKPPLLAPLIDGPGRAAWRSTPVRLAVARAPRGTRTTR